MVRVVRLGVLWSVVIAALAMLACGGVSRRDGTETRSNSAAGMRPIVDGPSGAGGKATADGELPNAAGGKPASDGEQPGAAGGKPASDGEQPGAGAGMPPFGGGTPTPGGSVLSICEDNHLTWGTVPKVDRFALDATLDGEPIRCETPDGQPPELSVLLAGAKYMNASLTLSCADDTLHVYVGSSLVSDGSCTSLGNGWSTPTATDSAYHDYEGTGSLTSSTILGPDAMSIPGTNDVQEHGVGTGSVHAELFDQLDAGLPPHILDGHFTLKASAIVILPPEQ